MNARLTPQQIADLERRLAQLTYRWRSADSQGRFTEADRFVQEYHSSIEVLWSSGWRGNSLLPEEELPEELMPEYFLAYWNKEGK